MKQTDIRTMVSIIDNLQVKYWVKMRKEDLFVVDTCYLLQPGTLSKSANIIVPFQVTLELKGLRQHKRIGVKVKTVLNSFKKQHNVIFQSVQSRDMCKKLFNVKTKDSDGHILALTLFMKRCYPFRNVCLLSHDKELNARCISYGIKIYPMYFLSMHMQLSMIIHLFQISRGLMMILTDA